MAGLHVLLVEDDDDNRELLAEVLAAEGLRVRTARSTEDGLAALAAERPEVVVSDVGLPGAGGLALAQAARALTPPVPVVLVTGWTSGPEVERARGLVAAVLAKPVDPEALVRTVTEVARGPGPL